MKLKVLLFQEDNKWVAQVLEHDITAQGRTTDEALYQLSRLIAGELSMREIDSYLSPFTEIPPAPKFYQNRYDNSANLSANLEELLPLAGMDSDRMPPPKISCRLGA